MANQIPRKAPSRFWYIIALILLVGGPIFAIGSIFKSIYGVVPHNMRVQDNKNLTVEKTGKYEIYAKNISLKETTPTVMEEKQGIEIRVIDKSGNTVQVQNITVSQDRMSAKTTYPLGSVQITEPGEYHIQINTSAPASLEFNYSPDTPTIVFTTLKGIMIFVGSVLLGTIIALTTYIKRSYGQEIQMLQETKPESTSMERFWAMSCHLSTLFGFLIPLGNIIAPLLIWLILRNDYYLVNDQGKESLNFQISIMIYYLIGALLVLLVIGVVILPLLALFQFIAVIIASIEAAQGKTFRYPLNIRLIR